MSQNSRILELLKSHENEWVPLYMILDLKPQIAKYSNRISELRAAGHEIVNKEEWVNGVCHSFYKLIPHKEAVMVGIEANRSNLGPSSANEGYSNIESQPNFIEQPDKQLAFA